MTPAMLKYGVISFCAFHIFCNVQSVDIKRKKYIFEALSSVFIGIIIGLLKTILAPFHVILMIIIFSFVYSLLFNLDRHLALKLSLLSFGFSYATYSASCLPVGLIILILKKHNALQSEWIMFLFVALLQITLIIASMKYKRLRKGLLYIVKTNSTDVGIYISLFLIISMSAFFIRDNMQPVYVVPIVLVLLCSIMLIFWRKNQITKAYIDKSKNNEIDRLEKVIKEKDEIINSLRKDNENLASIIHRDNKLLPAMMMGLEKYIGENSSPDAENILNQLKNIYNGRETVLKNYELSNKKLSNTGIASTDSVMLLMQKKAASCGADFALSILTDVQHFTDNIINEEDLNTLLSDMIENAIISTKKCSVRSVLVCINREDLIYSIEVYDSGENFDVEVLKNIGVKRTTTHIHEGGSGIGLMTIFSILNKYSASFVIEELLNNTDFSKKIRIVFDSLGTYKIITQRYDEIRSDLDGSLLTACKK